MRLAPLDVQPGYLSLLHYLWQKDNVLQKDLTALLNIEQATLSNTLKRMERDGLILRIPHKQDKRRHAITLTDKGRSVQSPVQSAIDDLRAVTNKGLTINDRRYLKRIISQMSEQLEEDQDDTLLILLDEVEE